MKRDDARRKEDEQQCENQKELINWLIDWLIDFNRVPIEVEMTPTFKAVLRHWQDKIKKCH